MTTQIANVARLLGATVHVYPVPGRTSIEHLHGKITGVDSVGISVVEDPDGSPGAEQFLPWMSIGRLVRV